PTGILAIISIRFGRLTPQVVSLSARAALLAADACCSGNRPAFGLPVLSSPKTMTPPSGLDDLRLAISPSLKSRRGPIWAPCCDDRFIHGPGRLGQCRFFHLVCSFLFKATRK